MEKKKKPTSRTKERRARRTSATKVTTPMTAQQTKMPAPSVVPTPILAEPVEKAAMAAMTSHAALPTAKNVTPATLGDSCSASTASVSDAQKYSLVVVSTRCSKKAIHSTNSAKVKTRPAVVGTTQ